MKTAAQSRSPSLTPDTVDHARVIALDADAQLACAGATSGLATALMRLAERGRATGSAEPHPATRLILDAVAPLRRAMALIADDSSPANPAPPAPSVVPRAGARRPLVPAAMGMGGRGVAQAARGVVVERQSVTATPPAADANERRRIALASLDVAAVGEVIARLAGPLSVFLSDHEQLGRAWSALRKRDRAEARREWVAGMAPVVAADFADAWPEIGLLSRSELICEAAFGLADAHAAIWFVDWLDAHPTLGPVWRSLPSGSATRSAPMAWFASRLTGALADRLWNGSGP